MSEVLAIFWHPDALELQRIPGYGVWPPSGRTVKSVKFPRPTRISRVSELAFSGELQNTLTQLLTDADISHPLWMMLPTEWCFSFQLDNPDLSPPDLNQTQLQWQVQLRLHGDQSQYRVWLPQKIDGSKVTAHVVYGDILDSISSVIRSLGVDLACVSAMPEIGARYSFDEPSDLREAVPVNQEPYVVIKARAGISPLIPAFLGALVLAAAGYLWLLPEATRPKPPKPIPEVSETNVTEPATQLSVATNQPAEPRDTIATKTAGQPSATSVLSPLTTLIQRLPAGATIQLATLSPVELKMEISGLGNPDAWVSAVQKNSGLERLRKTGSYTAESGAITVIRLENLNWNVGDGARDVDNWARLATSAGMKVTGRTALGGFQSAQTLIDALWQNPGGFSKIYLASDGGLWRVTVQ